MGLSWPVRAMWNGFQRRARRALPVALAVAVVASACSYTTDLAEPERESASSVVLDRDGNVLATIHAGEDREPVAMEQIAPTLPDAVVAIEDERFYEHPGVDAKAVIRAFVHNAEAGTVEEGASTITEQYVRTALLEPDRTVERKLREAVLAWELERRLDKGEILERYLNAVYFGRGAYGAEAAARRYFGKHAAELGLAESALLAGLVQAPEERSPDVDPDAARERRDLVLDRMAEQGYVSEADAAAARAAPLGVIDPPEEETYPAGHFVERVKDLVLADPAFGETPEQRRNLLYTGGLTIETTLDPHLQQLAEDAVDKVLSEPESDPAAALVSIDPDTGEVLAYVGGRDFFGAAPDAQFDLAGQGLRQTGSAFKPFALTAALEAGFTTERTYDAPPTITIPLPAPQEPWRVDNYANQGFGRLDLVDATVLSVNTVYAQLVDEIGPEAVVDAARRLGVRSELDAVPSAALGTNAVTVLDMASAYGTLAAGGERSGPILVSRVTDGDGKVLYEADRSADRVVDEDVAARVTDVLRQVPERGTGINARIGRPIAGKTGTTENNGDAWFVGYTRELATAVWVGFADEPRPMVPPTTRITVTGGEWPAEIWQLYQGAALADVPISPLTAAPAPGTGDTPLPPVEGMRGSEAATLLDDAGFTVRTEERPDPQYPPGTVLEQRPPARTPLSPGSEVMLVLAGAAREVTVPRVLGMRTEEAAFWLDAVGLAAEVTVEAEPPPGDPARAGRVWKQAPSGDSEVPQGSTVALRVNPG